MGALQPIHLLIIVGAILILFGGSKIPQLMRGIGQGAGEFKKGLEESKQTFEKHDEKKDEDDKKPS